MNHSDPLRRWAIQPADRRRHGTIAILVATALLSVGTASADPVPANQCGAHTAALDCVRDPSPPTPAEQYLLSTVGPHFRGIPQATLVQYARGTCSMLHAGTVTRYVAQDLASRLGTSTEGGGQVMDAAMAADCPNLRVGTDGVAR
jgi:hypothetical protein